MLTLAAHRDVKGELRSDVQGVPPSMYWGLVSTAGYAAARSRWWRPPTCGVATIRPTDVGMTARVIGTSLPSARCLRAHMRTRRSREHPVQPHRAEHDDVIEALTPDGPVDALHVGVLPTM